MGNRGNHIVLLAIISGLAFAASVCAEDYKSVGLQEGWGPDNVRAVQEELRDSGLYFGEIDGVYSSELAAALGRYQIRNGLPITGQLDAETSKALGAKPAVTTSSPNDQRPTSETWERLRKSDKQFPGKTVWRAPPPSAKENTTGLPLQSTPAVTTPGTSETAITTGMPPRSTPAAAAAIFSENQEPASSPPATVDRSPASDISDERLRDYVGAFVLAGLDPNVGSEADFFADRVQYYNDGMKDREKIREDLKRYDSRWPGRKFWLAGDITAQPQSEKRVRVTFPLRYELRNGAKRSSGKVQKTLVLEQAGDDLQIVAVNERKAAD
jgi:peptidoglycan hydrolase-like protein with peptidoglycan-binding domain